MRFRPAWVTASVFASVVAAQSCSNFGTASSDSCLCPPGFNPTSGTQDCTLPVCGGSLYEPGPAAPGGTGGYGNLSSGCGCSDGWTGPGCTVCQTSSACSASLSSFLNSSNSLTSTSLNTSLTCSTMPTVYSASQMSCSVIQPLLQGLFPGDSYLTITRSLNSSLVPGGTSTYASTKLVGGDNLLWAQLWYNGTEQFFCEASGCNQTVAAGSDTGVNASTWTCPKLSCECRSGTSFCGGGTIASQNISGAIAELSGPLTVDCVGGGNCTFQQALLKALFGENGLQLTSCSFGECVEQYVVDQALGIVSASAVSDNGLSGGVIAGLAVVGAILVAIVILLIWGVLARRTARRNMRTDGVLPKAGGVGITWAGVGYEIKPQASHLASKSLAWIKGSGSERAMFAEGGAAVGPNGGKIILRDVCGQLPPGAFCCILGPSGAGKSTLVDILAGKRKAGHVEGKVRFERDGDQRVKVGYVDQSDILSPTATVLETLLFAAYLRLPENIPKQVKEQRAHTVLAQLGLTDVANTRVGSSEHRGISGGEMRRVSIGVELVAAPDVLVLDEPTSGLDSVSAGRLIKLLKSLSDDEESKTTIVASIHQPSSALYHAFDQVVLLANGNQLYFGPGGSTAADFFARQGRPCPQGYNIADHLLDIASGSPEALLSGPAAMVAPDEGSRSPSSDHSHEGKTSSGSERQLVGTPGEKTVYPPQTLLKDGSSRRELDLTELGDEKQKRTWWPESKCSTTFLTQIEVLSGREWKNLERDKTLLVAHILLACVLGVFAGGLYYKVSLTIAGFQNRVGSLFFLGSLVAFSSLSALYNLVEVRGLFLRERAGSYYTSQAWLLSRILFDLIPLRLVPTILVGIIVYFMVGLSHEAARFFKFLLVLVEFSLAMTLWNFLLACVIRQGGVAILISSLCNLFLMTYAGFFVNIGNIPPVLRWLRYFSTLGYTLEALSVNEVGSGLQIIDELNGVPIQISATLIMETLFGFDLDHYYRDVLVLFAYIAGFGILLVGAVVYILRERR